MSRAFRLQGLLNLRQLQEEQAAGRLALANADLRQVEAGLQRSRENLRDAKVEAALDPQQLAVTAAKRTGAARRIQEQESDRELATEIVIERQDAWSGARRKTASLQKLEDHHIRQTFADELHKEQIVLDEMSRHRGPLHATDGANSGTATPAAPPVTTTIAQLAPRGAGRRGKWDLGGRLS